MIELKEHIDPVSLAAFPDAWRRELDEVLYYWAAYVTDQQQGFYGSVNNDNRPDPEAPVGLVMCSRILWAFSAAAPVTGNPVHRQMADRAYQFITTHFFDRKSGGVYWSVEPSGDVHDPKKQLYGQAFGIYGLSEYFRLTADPEALNAAIELFRLIEVYGFDKEKNGYIEAFARDWSDISDLRLSEKDHNERKTMNTHLHVIEAYVNLYTVWPDTKLKESIRNLLWLFDRYFINHQNYHLNLFFDDDWNNKSGLQSYGHDIEAAWLLQQSAEQLGDQEYIDHFRQLALPVTRAAAEGLDKDGGLWYEFEPASGELVKEKHSWPQAEAMVGFYNAWQLSGDSRFLQQCMDSWAFIEKYIIDHQKGEWFWGVQADYSVMQKDKAGFWKCPYHNTRALLELMRRINLK
jgi:mannobiose 2-epimerase